MGNRGSQIAGIFQKKKLIVVHHIMPFAKIIDPVKKYKIQIKEKIVKTFIKHCLKKDIKKIF